MYRSCLMSCLNKLRLRKIGNEKKIGWEPGLASSLPSKIQFLAIAVKTYAKAGIKILWSCPLLLHFYAKYFIIDYR